MSEIRVSFVFVFVFFLSAAGLHFFLASVFPFSRKLLFLWFHGCYCTQHQGCSTDIGLPSKWWSWFPSRTYNST